ncbi:class I SAM-dependent DNA methyltransferase [Microvirga pudoricolor]|uniref:class I SAM-dependent DNA methyltransferase n=1 Tax=Microvirga pudoricolor TaxID=2778729 RepID=UPI0019501CE0|nr:methyltransferase domain-containing protein [Microvirga pudoricolor]MBM6592928.1 methyltransferase domain-containing protein [Microvirga pudoricolor]
MTGRSRSRIDGAMVSSSALRTSGDLIADRRYEYARGAFDERDFEATADLARQVLELVPFFAPAQALLGRSLMELGHREEAIEALRQALSLEPDDALGVRLDLARLGALPAGEAISGGYVRALFDEYAPRFDGHLTGPLSYRGPELIADALRRACHERMRPHRFGLTLDLGCGTGLMGRALSGVASPLEGIDLSPRMLDQARKTHLYDALHEADLVSFLAGRPDGEADLAIAADVFVYMAGLEAAFAGAYRVLRPEGFFAFTVQAFDGEGFSLGEDARYAHSETYLRWLAATTGFSVVVLDAVSTRRDRDMAVPGYLAVLER